MSSFGRNDDLLWEKDDDCNCRITVKAKIKCGGPSTPLRSDWDDAVMELVGSGWAFAGFYFFEEPDNSYAEKTKEREPAEDVDEGPIGGLTA